MHAISTYRGNRPTNKQTQPQTHKQMHTQTGPITIHCAAKLSAQSNNNEQADSFTKVPDKKPNHYCIFTIYDSLIT